MAAFEKKGGHVVGRKVTLYGRTLKLTDASSEVEIGDIVVDFTGVSEETILLSAAENDWIRQAGWLRRKSDRFYAWAKPGLKWLFGQNPTVRPMTKEEKLALIAKLQAEMEAEG